MIRAILILSAVFIAACAGNPAQESSAVPVSEQTPTGDAQQRAKVHTDLGMLYTQAGNMGVAIQEARIALEADPNFAPAYNLLGLVHMMLRESSQAQSNFEQALKLAPGDPEIANNYGWFLCQAGRETEAIQQFMLSAKNPHYKTPTKPNTNAGLCALRLKDDKTAEEFFQRALVADPSNAQAIFHLADIAYRRGDYTRARRLVGEVHRINEPNAESLWLALRTERKLGDRQAEAGFSSQLRRKFTDSKEYQALIQGRFD